MNQELISSTLGILPELIVLLGAFAVMTMDMFAFSRRNQVWFAGVVLLGAMIPVIRDIYESTIAQHFSGSIVIDPLSQISKLVILGGSFFVLCLSDGFRKLGQYIQGEFSTLLLLSILGMMMIVSSGDFMMLFLGIELMSLPVYALVGSHLNDPRSQESAIKYLVLGAFSAGFFMMGVAFLYGASGTIQIAEIKTLLTNGDLSVLALTGSIFVMVGMLFKVSIVPFHSWAPDVYEGAPIPVTAFMAAIVKTTGFIAMIRVFGGVIRTNDPSRLSEAVLYLGVASVILGNIWAVTQSNLKRLFAYSSIAHSGFMLLALLGSNISANVLFYAITYILSQVAAFGVMTVLMVSGKEVRDVGDLRGLSQRSPGLALAMTIALLSMGGIPPLPGFLAKFFVVQELLQQGHVVGAVLALVASVFALYYYLKVVVSMYFEPGMGTELEIGQTLMTKFSGVFTAIILIALGLMPSILLWPMKNFLGAP